jgi:hypothetical protein
MTRRASFSASTGGSVSVLVDGRRWSGSPGAVPLSPHSEIVLEVGPYVPPRSVYTFPLGTRSGGIFQAGWRCVSSAAL